MAAISDLSSKMLYCLKMMYIATFVYDQVQHENRRRILGRHHFIYLHGFIELASQLKNLLKQKGDVGPVEQLINRLRSDYEKEYKDIRNRLAAHQQGEWLDTLVALWSEVAKYNLVILTQDSETIYTHLRWIDDTIPVFEQSTEVNDTNLRNILSEVDKHDSGPIFSEAGFALLDPRVITVIPTGLLGQCRQRIAALNDIISLELSLLRSNLSSPDVERFLKAATIVDVISLVDTLYPIRQLGPNASPTLYSLLQGHQHSHFIELQNAANNRKADQEKKIIDARNKIGAHIDALIDLEALLVELLV